MNWPDTSQHRSREADDEERRWPGHIDRGVVFNRTPRVGGGQGRGHMHPLEERLRVTGDRRLRVSAGHAGTCRANDDVDDACLDRAGLVEYRVVPARRPHRPHLLDARLADGVESYGHFEIGGDHVGLHFAVYLDERVIGAVTA